MSLIHPILVDGMKFSDALLSILVPDILLSMLVSDILLLILVSDVSISISGVITIDPLHISQIKVCVSSIWCFKHAIQTGFVQRHGLTNFAVSQI
jgi:hypothetical protein